METVRHPLAPSNVPTALRSKAACALAAEECKYKKYSFLSGKAIFAAAAVETLGAFGTSASYLVKRITKLQGPAVTGAVRYSRNRLTRPIVCAVFEGNAASVLEAYSRAPTGQPTSLSETLATAGPFSRAGRVVSNLEGPPPPLTALN